MKTYIVFEDDVPAQEKRIHEVKEDQTPEGDISIIKLIIACITEKGFIWKLSQALKYALRYFDSYRGEGSSDVLLFRGTKNFDKIWRKK
jgi:hypothetical protein